MTVTEIAFTGYPVTDVARARDFYERVLGLKPAMAEAFGENKQWVEYDVGPATLALSNAWPPSGQPGPGVALEVDDFDAALEELRAAGVKFITDVMDSPVCRLAVITDPDGNWLTIHKRKAKPERHEA